MRSWSPEFAVVVTIAILLSSLQIVFGIRFVIDKEECFSHKVEYDGDIINFSFVVIKSERAWHYAPDGVDLVVSFTIVQLFNTVVYWLVPQFLTIRFM